MTELLLANGLTVLIDDADKAAVAMYRWFAVQGKLTQYAQANVRRPDGAWTTIHMHHLLMGKAPVGRTVDHADGNGLNNSRANLRWATRAEQARNHPRPRNNTSGFKGVCWCKRERKWLAQVTFDRHKHHVGYFSDLESAARAYDSKALELFGEFARLNFSA